MIDVSPKGNGHLRAGCRSSRVAQLVAHIVPRSSCHSLALPYVDVHRCGDVRVTQSLLHNLVANSESEQVHCDHQTCIREWVGPCRGVNSSCRRSVKAIERLKGSPAPPGPKPAFRTVVSELARRLTFSCKSVGHAKGHDRTIRPGLVLQVTVRART